MTIILTNRIEKIFDFKNLKEDARKLGINLITAGTAGLFVTHIAGLTQTVVLSSIWLVTIGLLTTLFGLYRGKS